MPVISHHCQQDAFSGSQGEEEVVLNNTAFYRNSDNPCDTLASNLGTVAVVYQISRKDRFPKKMYMGVCSVESIKIRKIMRVFPMRGSKYTVRNITNNESCSEEEPGNPKKMNGVTADWFVTSIFRLLYPGRDQQHSGR